MSELEQKKSKSFFTLFTIFNVVIFLAVIISNFYFFYFKKDYDFIVETPCDLNTEECFQRDCSEPDTCPPNELSEFKRYTIKANDFKFCPNEDCTLVCESGEMECIPIECTEDIDMGESCISPEVEAEAEIEVENNQTLINIYE